MARILDQVVGHQKIIERLLDAKRRDHFPATLLFTGPEGVGRMLVARGLAQALCCEVKPEGCGQCGSCLRIAKEQSESLRIVAAEKNQIKIEQAREVLEFLSLQAQTPYRIIIFEHAEILNQQAANALLKILEEPPARTVFFLIARTPQHVLTTVRSRSVHVPFSPLTAQELASKIKAPAWALAAAQGSFARLNDLMESTEQRETAIEMIDWWLESPQAYLRAAFRERVKDRSMAQQLARDLQGFFRDVKLTQFGATEGLSFADQGELLKRGLEQAGAADEAFRLALGLERELALGSRDSLLAFEEFWIRSHLPRESPESVLNS